MKIIPQSVKLQTPADGCQALRQIEYAARTCYRSREKMADASSQKFVRSLIKRGHLSPLEFANMSVELTTSRDVMAELTRHRFASFCVESQRYVCVKDSAEFIQPLFYLDGNPASEFWRQCMLDAEESYRYLLDSGQRSEDARKVLPNSTATRIVMKANLREWRHVFELRLNKRAYPEMRQLMTLLLTEARHRIPVVFDDVEISC